MNGRKAFLKGKNNVPVISPFLIGRSMTAQIILRDVSISREHCQIWQPPDSNTWFIKSKGIAGTLLNGENIEMNKDVPLNNGDLIQVGLKELDAKWIFCCEDNVKDGVTAISTKTSGSQGSKIQNTITEHLPEMEQNLRDMEDELDILEASQMNSGEIINDIKHLKIKMKKLKERNVVLENKKLNFEEELESLKKAKEELDALVKEQMKQQHEKSVEGNSSGQIIGSAELEKQLSDTVKKEVAKEKDNIIENFTELMESELQCSICNELLVCTITLNCTHSFCKYCIETWKKKKKDCPVCRAKITSEVRSLVMDNYIDKMVAKLSQELKTRREALVKERTIVAVPAQKNKKKKFVVDLEASSSSSIPVVDLASNTPSTASEDREDSESSNSDQDNEWPYDFDVTPIAWFSVPYYGGYGRCYICNQRGHWAPGCPFK